MIKYKVQFSYNLSQYDDSDAELIVEIINEKEWVDNDIYFVKKSQDKLRQMFILLTDNNLATQDYQQKLLFRIMKNEVTLWTT